MTSNPGTRTLTAASAEAFVRDWHGSLLQGVPVEDLLPQLANGLRLELPAQVVRGAGEFRTWHAAGPHVPVADRRLAAARLDVRLSSPVHAEVSCVLPADADRPETRQQWSLVLRDGRLRIRTLAVRLRPESAPALVPAAAEPALAGA
ncbi:MULTISPECIES: hypothetical protein [unclassified Streptomyces]|uniref:hypothetical protein n=1 Tax=unclassified Streptomyces TaxID=2593676 RepID=UPI00380C6325